PPELSRPAAAKMENGPEKGIRSPFPGRLCDVQRRRLLLATRQGRWVLSMVKLLENVVFKLRAIILLGLLVFTCITGFYALQLRMTAGFDKQLPVGHEYIQTFTEYREQLFGSNRIIVVLEPKEGDVWSKEFFKVYKNLTDDIFFLPGVSRHTVTSLWTPNTRYIEITEDGISADDVISGKVTADSMTPQNLEKIQSNVIRGGFVGRLVADDFGSAMVV